MDIINGGPLRFLTHPPLWLLVGNATRAATDGAQRKDRTPVGRYPPHFDGFVTGRSGGAVSPHLDGGDHPDVGVLHLRQPRSGVQIPEGECPVPVGISAVNERFRNFKFQ